MRGRVYIIGGCVTWAGARQASWPGQCCCHQLHSRRQATAATQQHLLDCSCCSGIRVLQALRLSLLSRLQRVCQLLLFEL